MHPALGNTGANRGGTYLAHWPVPPDLIGSRIYGEEKVAFMNDISILEINADQRPADLGAELDLLNRGKLTNETQPRVTRQRLAHHDLREGRSRRRCRCVTRIAEPCRERSDGKRRTRPITSVRLFTCLRIITDNFNGLATAGRAE